MVVVRVDFKARECIVTNSYDSKDDENIKVEAEALFWWAKEKGRLCKGDQREK